MNRSILLLALLFAFSHANPTELYAFDTEYHYANCTGPIRTQTRDKLGCRSMTAQSSVLLSYQNGKFEIAQFSKSGNCQGQPDKPPAVQRLNVCFKGHKAAMSQMFVHPFGPHDLIKTFYWHTNCTGGTEFKVTAEYKAGCVLGPHEHSCRPSKGDSNHFTMMCGDQWNIHHSTASGPNLPTGPTGPSPSVTPTSTNNNNGKHFVTYSYSNAQCTGIPVQAVRNSFGCRSRGALLSQKSEMENGVFVIQAYLNSDCSGTPSQLYKPELGVCKDGSLSVLSDTLNPNPKDDDLVTTVYNGKECGGAFIEATIRYGASCSSDPQINKCLLEKDSGNSIKQICGKEYQKSGSTKSLIAFGLLFISFLFAL